MHTISYKNQFYLPVLQLLTSKFNIHLHIIHGFVNYHNFFKWLSGILSCSNNNMTPFLVQITIIEGEYSNIQCRDVRLKETERSTPTTPHTLTQ